VFWQVGSSATLGTNTLFTGNIMANISITATTGATLDGRALARTGAVTLDTNTVNVPSCP
jgi:type VI secretion system secreted protein VgrG